MLCLICVMFDERSIIINFTMILLFVVREHQSESIAATSSANSVS